MFLLFQPLSKQKLLPSKAQKLPQGGFQLCVGVQFPYATGDSKSLSAPNKGSVPWQVKLEIHVLCYCNRHKESPGDKCAIHSALPTQSFNHPNRNTQLEKSAKSFSGLVSATVTHVTSRPAEERGCSYDQVDSTAPHLASSGDSAIRWKVLSAMMMSIPFSLLVLSMISLQGNTSTQRRSGTENECLRRGKKRNFTVTEKSDTSPSAFSLWEMMKGPLGVGDSFLLKKGGGLCWEGGVERREWGWGRGLSSPPGPSKAHPVQMPQSAYTFPWLPHCSIKDPHWSQSARALSFITAFQQGLRPLLTPLTSSDKGTLFLPGASGWRAGLECL